jgi:hypothetical protein
MLKSKDLNEISISLKKLFQIISKIKSKSPDFIPFSFNFLEVLADFI